MESIFDTVADPNQLAVDNNGTVWFERKEFGSKGNVPFNLDLID